MGNVWRSIAEPPARPPTLFCCKNVLMVVSGVKVGKPQKGIYEFIDGKNVDGKADNHGSWKLVGNMSVGRYRHAAVPVGSHGTALFVAGGYVEGDPMGDETHDKSCSTELVAL